MSMTNVLKHHTMPVRCVNIKVFFKKFTTIIPGTNEIYNMGFGEETCTNQKTLYLCITLNYFFGAESSYVAQADLAFHSHC